MKKIKKVWNDHKTEIIIIGGVILTTTSIIFLKKDGNVSTPTKRVVDGFTGYSKEKVLDFINGADDDLKYAIFKESDFFTVVHL